MKKLLVPALSFFWLANFAQAEVWPLESADASLTLHGRPRPAAGAVGQGLVLESNAMIELKDSGGLNGSQEGFTFSVWFNPYALDNGQQLIAGKNRYAENERQWSLTLEPDGHLRAHVRQKTWSQVTAKTKLKPGHWHLATLTVGAGKAALYVNGKLEGEAALTIPVPATAAPISLGGVREDGKTRQPFLGAVDEARYEARRLTSAEIASFYQPVSVTHEVYETKLADFPLWDDKQPLLTAEALPSLKDVEFHVIKKHEPEVDGYPWLHGVGLAWHKGKLYSSFGHNEGAENTASEEARGRVSEDGGKTWGEVFTVDVGAEAPDLAVSHGVYLSHQGKLWAFHGAFYGHMGRIHTRAYVLDESTGRWQPKGSVVGDGFWALNQPVKMADGNWIMAGIRGREFSQRDINPAAVAISHGDDFTKWDLVSIPTTPGLRLWGESSVIVDGAEVISIARYGIKARALVAKSTDYGRTWTPMAESNLPMTTSKPCSGLLSNGQRYLVCTTAKDNGAARAPLTIAVSRPGEKTFSQIFSIRPALFPSGPGESHPKSRLSYPCALEHEGKLYVGFSNTGGRGGNHNSAEMAVIPLSSLQVDPASRD